MHPPIEKPAGSTPTSANVGAYRGLVNRPRREQLKNGHRAGACRFTVLARASYPHGEDARTLLPWLRGVGDEIGLSRVEQLRRSILKALERIDWHSGAGDMDGMMRRLP
jgi:hypothetical protein